jgi:hypothetical protein
VIRSFDISAPKLGLDLLDRSKFVKREFVHTGLDADGASGDTAKRYQHYRSEKINNIFEGRADSLLRRRMNAAMQTSRRSRIDQAIARNFALPFGTF